MNTSDRIQKRNLGHEIDPNKRVRISAPPANSPCFLLTMPLEILTHIFKEPCDHFIMRLTCKALNRGLAKQKKPFNPCVEFAKRGDLKLLQWASKYFSKFLDKKLVARAAARGSHIPVLEWLKPDLHEIKPILLEAPDQIPVLEWGHRRGAKLTDKISAAAAKACALLSLQWLAERGCPMTKRTFSKAAAGGNIAVLEWLRAKKCPEGTKATRAAAKNGHLGALQWLYERGHRIGPRIAFSAAAKGYLPLLKWLHAMAQVTLDREEQDPSLDIELSPEAFTLAAENGHKEILAWADAVYGIDSIKDIGSSIARFGDIKIAEWALTRTSKPDFFGSLACAHAAANNKLPMLEWLKAHHVPWDNATCYMAKELGHQTLLEWALARGAPQGPVAEDYLRQCDLFEYLLKKRIRNGLKKTIEELDREEDK